MRGTRKEQHDQAVHEPRRPPFDFVQGRLHYASQKRRRHHRHRLYRIMAALVILAMGTGIVVVLVLNWFAGQLSQ
jgi:hypothetical protein